MNGSESSKQQGEQPARLDNSHLIGGGFAPSDAEQKPQIRSSVEQYTFSDSIPYQVCTHTNGARDETHRSQM